MSDPAGFPNVEDAVLDLCADLFAADRLGTDTPSDLQARLPFLRVNRAGGPNDQFTDRPRVSVDVFAATYAAVVASAEAVRQRICSAPRPAGTAYLDRGECLSGPVELPWADEKVRRRNASYRLDLRR